MDLSDEDNYDKEYLSESFGETSEESESEYEQEPEAVVVPRKVKGKARARDEEVENEENELENDDDFDRLVLQIREGKLSTEPNILQGSTSHGVVSGGGGGTWSFSIEDLRDYEESFRDELRQATGIGKKRGRKRGRKGTVPLSSEVSALIGQGNQAFVDGDTALATQIMTEVIRIEPRAEAAWHVLAQCADDRAAAAAIRVRAGGSEEEIRRANEEARRERERALALRVMAAHLSGDTEEWQRLANDSRIHGYHRQALYCYRKLYQSDPSNVNALWERAELASEIGDMRTARNSLVGILKHHPHDLSVLSQLRPILIELGDLETCASLYADAFEHFVGTSNGPPTEGHQQNLNPDQLQTTLTLMEILVLADLQTTLRHYVDAIRSVRRGCRWLQGRGAQRFWDAVEDDREFDVVHHHSASAPAVEETGVQGEASNADGTSNRTKDIAEANVGNAGVESLVWERTIRSGEVQPGYYPLDINARHRLAITRIKMGDVVEGRRHATLVLSQDPLEYGPLFGEIADAYFEREMWAEAGKVYEMLGADAGTSSLYVLMQAAACRRMLGDLKEAAEVYEHVIQADSTNNEAKMKLAEIYEILNEPRKALNLVLEVIDSRRRRNAAKDPSTPHAAASSADISTTLFEETSRAGTAKDRTTRRTTKLTHAQLKELEGRKEQEASMSYVRVRETWGRMLGRDLQGTTDEEREKDQEEAEREWMREAEKLVESFRETRPLFLSSRQHGFRGVFPRSGRPRTARNAEATEENMADRLQLELGRSTIGRKKDEVLTSFRTISFEDWLRLFMQYAFILTQRGDYEEAKGVLQHILYSNAFQKPIYLDSIRLAIIACSISAGQHDTIVTECRKLINAHQFNNEPYRLLLACLGSGLRATDAFLANTLGKHLLRELRANDAATKNPESLKWNVSTRKWGQAGARVEEGEEDEVGVTAQDASIGTSGTDGQTRMPTKMNPVGVAVYGMVCLASKSYQSAIFYLLHAYDYCPHDPLICLTLAIACIGRAMQRQSDNRHYLITQGMAFLTRYRAIRLNDTDRKGLDEVEFNFGRAFHNLGLLTLAVKHYQNVLDFAEERVKTDPEDVGFAREAAYNLALIYTTTGATLLAERLYRKWLSV